MTKNDATTIKAKLSVAKAELAEQDRKFSSFEQELRRHRKETARLRSELAGKISESSTALAKAEQVRKETAIGLRSFQREFEEALAEHRRQRAWTVMLMFRKAYTLVFREGLAGVVKLLRWALTLPFRPSAGLEPYELQFPTIDKYVPAELEASFLNVVHRRAPAADASEGAGAADSVGGKYDVFIFPVFEFDFRFQRPQQLAVQFSRQGHRVFWVSPARVAAPTVGRPYEAVQLRENLWEIRLAGEHPNIYSSELRVDQAEVLLGGLFDFCRDWNVAENAAIIELPFWRRIALAMRKRLGTRILYDCIDHWATMPNIGEFNGRQEAQLMVESDVAAVTSRQLLETHRSTRSDTILVRNGTDFDFFAVASSNGELSHIPSPRVGYFGAIADWFDYDLVYEVAKLRPEYSFVLIGGYGLEEDPIGEKIPRLRKLPNVFLLGHKNYKDMPGYLAQFDGCIIPFLLNEVTRATDPVKLYEYFSQGKPVVATSMEELKQWGDLLYLADEPQEFVAKVDLALTEHDDSLKYRRIAFAAQNRWEDRYLTMDEALRKSFPLVSILILTYNSKCYVKACLDSIVRNTSYPNYEVIVVDNGSKDGTQALIAKHAAEHSNFRILNLSDNRGFAGGNNVAAEQARGDYYVFLNIDTVVSPGWVERLLRHVRGPGSSVGTVVPATNWAGNEARINVDYDNLSQMESFARGLARDRFGESLEIAVAPLFCALVPREVWATVGVLDDGYEIGMFEDDDYSHRIRESGFRILCAEDCFVHHFGQGAFAKLDAAKYQKIFTQNKQRYEDKWGIQWKPHKYRPGAGMEIRRYDPGSFLSGSEASRS